MAASQTPAVVMDKYVSPPLKIVAFVVHIAYLNLSLAERVTPSLVSSIPNRPFCTYYPLPSFDALG